jgi:GNAT superfamily N-acetyltransferase
MEDVAAIHYLVIRTIDACYPPVYPAAVVEYFRQYHSVEQVRAAVDEEFMLVLVEQGAIIGTGALKGDEVRRVFVDVAHQHRGLGRLITGRLEQQAREAGLRSVVLDASLPARAFYESMGYRVTKFEPGEEGGTLTPDHFRMARDL